MAQHLLVGPMNGPWTRQPSQTYIANVSSPARWPTSIDHDGLCEGCIISFQLTIACALYRESWDELRFRDTLVAFHSARRGRHLDCIQPLVSKVLLNSLAICVVSLLLELDYLLSKSWPSFLV